MLSETAQKDQKANQALSIVGHDRDGKRPELDFYPTPRVATEALLDRYTFNKKIWEPACGDGAMSKVLIERGYKVISSDIRKYGYEETIGHDFLKTKYEPEDPIYNIITNPPFRLSEEFVRKSMELVQHDGYICIFNKLQFLEGQKRKLMFKEYPPMKVHVFSKRLSLTRDGKPMKNSGMLAFAWFVWKVGRVGRTTELEWI